MKKISDHMRDEDSEIDAKDVIIWSSYTDTSSLRVFEWLSPDDLRFQDSVESGFHASYGACNTHWKELSDRVRILELYEIAISLCVRGFPPDAVIAEFLKIRQFADQGAQSNWMARAFTKAVTGEECEGLERWAARSSE
jgi:hypothetical protein